ncbi:MAG: PAS domain-containing sensor histidine kinase [Bacteroidota bacterium]|jgi:signal transduction histidine kinase
MNLNHTSIDPDVAPLIEEAITRLLFEHASGILIVMDPDGRILRASASLELLTGKKVRGMNVHELIIDFQGTLELSTLCSGKSDGQILHLSTHDGLPASFRFFGRKVGEYYFLFAETIEADLRRLRAELLNLNAEMHDVSRELQRRNVQLEELNKQKNQFLGIAAHDLRNPLGVIMAFSEILLDDAADTLTVGQRDILSTMRESSQFMLTLINNLLDISAIESGKLNLDLAATDFAELIRKNLARNSFLAVKKGIRIEQEIAADLPMLVIDAGKCEQVLNNLVTNAVKFSASGTVVTVNCSREHDTVVLSVQDQGQGIPDEELGKLFKPFSRTSVRSTAGETSTGLGLAIVKRILDGHGASIEVRSAVGEGSCFTITFPIPSKTETV